MTQFISVPKILKALQTLKTLGHPYYQFIKIGDDFVDNLKDNDIEGFNFLYPEDEIDNHSDRSKDSLKGLKETDINGLEQCKDKKDSLDDNLDDSDRDEHEYQKNDVVKKWQFNYNQSTCFSHNYPEIDYREDNSTRISIAPGEGKYPSNILNEQDWDIKSFPTLLPDGLNSLHAKRKVRLTDQDYFVQRILNKDRRFAQNPAFIFAATSFIETKQINGRK